MTKYPQTLTTPLLGPKRGVVRVLSLNFLKFVPPVYI